VALAAVAALVGGGLTGGTRALLIHQFLDQQWDDELETLMEAGVWSSGFASTTLSKKKWLSTSCEISAERLCAYMRSHSISGLDDIPLSSIKPDPLLEEPLGKL
jgi:hypothetical protein